MREKLYIGQGRPNGRVKAHLSTGVIQDALAPNSQPDEEWPWPALMVHPVGENPGNTPQNWNRLNWVHPGSRASHLPLCTCVSSYGGWRPRLQVQGAECGR